MTIRRRLTLFNALAIVAIVALLLTVLVVVAIRGTTQSVRQASRAAAQEVARSLEGGSPPDGALLQRLAEGGVFVVVRDGGGRVVAQTPGAVTGVTAEERRRGGELWRQALASGEPVSSSREESHAYVLPVAGAADRWAVEAWSSFDAFDEAVVPFDRVLIVLIPLTLAAAITGSYLLTRAALRPVDGIARAARDISAGDLSRRLPVESATDELGRLATTFNDLLARLEVAFADREATLLRQRRFVADASHELRTPLSAILGYARMLAEWGLSDSAVGRESAAAIADQSARMQALVDGLLALAHGDEGPPLETSPHDLARIVAGAVETARIGAPDRIRIEFVAPPEPVIALVDAVRIGQAIGIVLDNAVKYTPGAGQIDVGVRDLGTGAEVTVHDTGLGIAAHHLPLIFERFYRVDDARSGAGTGLGLAIARQILELHGGDIAVVSEPGRGSCFSLRLPTAGHAARVKE